MPPDQKLKREISTANVLIAAAGGMIGSGWLFSPFVSAQIAGSNALISWVIAAVFMVLIALPLCELGAIMLFVAVLNTYGVKLLAECNKYASLIKFGVPSLAVASLLYTSPSFDNIQ